MGLIAVLSFVNLKVRFLLFCQKFELLKTNVHLNHFSSSLYSLSPLAYLTACSSTQESVYLELYSAFSSYQKQDAKINSKVIRRETGNSNAGEKRALFCMTAI